MSRGAVVGLFLVPDGRSEFTGVSVVPDFAGFRMKPP